MAVVEVGTYSVRAGYIGDATCTRCLPALCSAAAPEEVDLFSILYAANRSLPSPTLASSTTAVGNANADDGMAGTSAGLDARGAGALLPLWSLRQIEKYPDAHMDSLRRLKRDVLETTEQDPLCLVLPEVWFERTDVMEALIQLLLESPGLTTALYCVRPSLGWTFASGATSSIVLDIGHSHATVTAVLDGYAMRHSVDMAPMGGAVITAQYRELLSRYRPAVEGAAPLLTHPLTRETYWDDWVADVKHSLANVLPYPGGMSGDAPSSLASGKTAAAPATKTSLTTLMLQAPDGARVHLEAHKAALPFEVFFGDATDEKRNVATMMATCKRRMDPEWQLHTIPHLLVGAGSLVPGFRDRMLEELKAQDSSYFRYEREGALTATQTADGAWVGASMAASSSSFDPLWITRGEWEEEGPSALYRKLFY